MKIFLIVTVFFVTLISYGDASSIEDNVDEKLAGSATEDEANTSANESQEKQPLAQSMGSEDSRSDAVGFISSVETKPLAASGTSREKLGKSVMAHHIPGTVSSCESITSSEEMKAPARLQGEPNKQVGHDYFRVDSGDTSKEKLNQKELDEETKQHINEIADGDMTLLLGTNQHLMQPDLYPDFSRRFVLQYPYKEIVNTPEEQMESHLIPKLAPPELVLQIAKESAMLDAVTPVNPSDDLIYKDILRSGKYWNSYWKEDVDPKLLRTQPKKLRSVKAKVLPGSDIYELVAKLKEISPKLLYVVNKRSRQ